MSNGVNEGINLEYTSKEQYHIFFLANKPLKISFLIDFTKLTLVVSIRNSLGQEREKKEQHREKQLTRKASSLISDDMRSRVMNKFARQVTIPHWPSLSLRAELETCPKRSRAWILIGRPPKDVHERQQTMMTYETALSKLNYLRYRNVCYQLLVP